MVYDVLHGFSHGGGCLEMFLVLFAATRRLLRPFPDVFGLLLPSVFCLPSRSPGKKNKPM